MDVADTVDAFSQFGVWDPTLSAIYHLVSLFKWRNLAYAKPDIVGVATVRCYDVDQSDTPVPAVDVSFPKSRWGVYTDKR